MRATHTFPYRNEFGTGARPYVAVRVTGLNGSTRLISGLIDSGADRTSLPMAFTSAMGYGSDTLRAAKLRVADGSDVAVWTAKVPVEAYVAGRPDLRLELRPMFVPGRNVQALWGRADFFKPFRVGFEEAAQRFSLTAA